MLLIMLSCNRHVSPTLQIENMSSVDTDTTTTRVVTFNYFHFLKLLPMSTCQYRVSYNKQQHKNLYVATLNYYHSKIITGVSISAS